MKLLLLFIQLHISTPSFVVYDGKYILPENEYNCFKSIHEYFPEKDEYDIEIDHVVFNVYAENIKNYYIFYQRKHDVILKDVTYNFIYDNSKFNYSFKEVYRVIKGRNDLIINKYK